MAYCDEQEGGVETLQQQKLDAMKELAYGASHEINNPLANIAARAQTLLLDEEHPERRRALEAIHQQAMRAHEMISDLMLFARPPRLELHSFDLCHVLMSVKDDLASECQRRNIRLNVTVPSSACVFHGDQQQLIVALRAVADNAMQAVGQDGDVEITLQRHASLAAEQLVTIEVADTGTGISAEVQQHLFDPFYSGREAGRGLGFGLSKCWRIVTDHDGEVVVANNDRGGATISLVLPVAGPAV